MSAPAHDAGFAPGAPVTLAGLATARLNGAKGILVERSGGRWIVRLAADKERGVAGGRLFNVRPENLTDGETLSPEVSG